MVKFATADAEALLNAIQYENLSDNPDTTDRTLDVTVDDGDVASNIATATITVVPINDPPVIDLDNDGPNGDAAYSNQFTEDGAAVPLTDGSGTISDVDDTSFVNLSVSLGRCAHRRCR